MSADAWQECPRCKERGDLDSDYRGRRLFREDYEIGLEEDEPVVEVRYRGECQQCNLLVEFVVRKPVTW